MSIVSYTTIGGGLVTKDKETNRRYWWMDTSSVSRQRSIYRRSDIKTLPSFSLLGQAADAWNLLSAGDKASWEAAAGIVGLHGYNLFIQDKSYRLMNSIAGNATPSLYHQYLVGHVNIPEGAGDVYLRQSGNEILSFPASLSVNRKTVLLGDPVNGQYCKVRFSYEYDEGAGVQTQTDEISLSLSSSWGTETVVITSHTGLTGAWTLEIETHAVKGDLYFDDLFVSSLTSVLGIDPFCLNVVRYWLLIAFPFSCLLESLYPQGGAL